MGLPTVDDPDAAVHLRADAEAAAFAQKFIELGIDPDQIVQITRMLAEGLSRAAEVMRYAALASVLDPTATELGIAKNSEALRSEVAPMLGPMIQETLRSQLRHLHGDRGRQCQRAGRGTTASRRPPGDDRLRRPRRLHPASARRCRRRT